MHISGTLSCFFFTLTNHSPGDKSDTSCRFMSSWPTIHLLAIQKSFKKTNVILPTSPFADRIGPHGETNPNAKTTAYRFVDSKGHIIRQKESSSIKSSIPRSWTAHNLKEGAPLILHHLISLNPEFLVLRTQRTQSIPSFISSCSIVEDSVT